MVAGGGGGDSDKSSVRREMGDEQGRAGVGGFRAKAGTPDRRRPVSAGSCEGEGPGLRVTAVVGHFVTPFCFCIVVVVVVVVVIAVAVVVFFWTVRYNRSTLDCTLYSLFALHRPAADVLCLLVVRRFHVA